MGDRGEGDVWVDLVLGGPVQDVLGLSFVLTYPPKVVDIIGVEPGSLLGPDAILYAHKEEQAGRLSVGITRKIQQGGIGMEGPVVRLRLRPKSPALSSVKLSIKDGLVGDVAGDVHPIIEGPTATLTLRALPEAVALHANFPNPFNPLPISPTISLKPVM